MHTYVNSDDPEDIQIRGSSDPHKTSQTTNVINSQCIGTLGQSSQGIDGETMRQWVLKGISGFERDCGTWRVS
eukprot:scaffold485085_cov19-Prasinocladus_malaysianus.AAC.1